MKRLIVVSFVSVPLMILIACTGDPTESLRGGIVQLNPAPSQIFLQHGKTTSVDVTATDEQGNQIATVFAAANVGAGLTVQRDLTFQPVFVNDSTLAPPDSAVMFRFKVTADELVGSSFKLTAGDKDVTVPVTVLADPLEVPLATVASTGPTAADQTVLTLPAPFVFTPAAAVTFDAGAGIPVARAADGSSLTIFPPPGTTSTGAITGVGLTYLSSADFSTVTDVPLAISTIVPPQPGTDNPATAPDVTPPAGGTTAFYDGTAFASPLCGGANGGLPCQVYKIILPADGTIDVVLGKSNTTDLGVYVLTADGTADIPSALPSPCDVNFNDAVPEACTFTLPAGTYLLGVVNYGQFYPPPDDATPDWISLSLTRP